MTLSPRYSHQIISHLLQIRSGENSTLHRIKDLLKSFILNVPVGLFGSLIYLAPEFTFLPPPTDRISAKYNLGKQNIL